MHSNHVFYLYIALSKLLSLLYWSNFLARRSANFCSSMNIYERLIIQQTYLCWLWQDTYKVHHKVIQNGLFKFFIIVQIDKENGSLQWYKEDFQPSVVFRTIEQVRAIEKLNRKSNCLCKTLTVNFQPSFIKIIIIHFLCRNFYGQTIHNQYYCDVKLLLHHKGCNNNYINSLENVITFVIRKKPCSIRILGEKVV